MSDIDQTPRIPDLWFSATHGVITHSSTGGYWHLLDNEAWPLPLPEHEDESLPADAVRLGDVEALRAELNAAVGRANRVVLELAALRAEIRSHIGQVFSRERLRDLAGGIDYRQELEEIMDIVAGAQ